MKEKLKNILRTSLSIIIGVWICILSIPLSGNKRRNNEVTKSSPILWLFLSPKMLNTSNSNTFDQRLNEYKWLNEYNYYNIKKDQETNIDENNYSKLYAKNWLSHNINVFKESVSFRQEWYDSIDCSRSKKAICPTYKEIVWKFINNEKEILSFYEVTYNYIDNNSYDNIDEKYIWTIIDLFENRMNLYKSFSETLIWKCDEDCEEFIKENQDYIDNYNQFFDILQNT